MIILFWMMILVPFTMMEVAFYLLFVVPIASVGAGIIAKSKGLSVPWYMATGAVHSASLLAGLSLIA